MAKKKGKTLKKKRNQKRNSTSGNRTRKNPEKTIEIPRDNSRFTGKYIWAVYAWSHKENFWGVFSAYTNEIAAVNAKQTVDTYAGFHKTSVHKIPVFEKLHVDIHTEESYAEEQELERKAAQKRRAKRSGKSKTKKKKR